MHSRSQSGCTNIPAREAAGTRARPARNPDRARPLREHPRVFQVPVADVVGGEREPGAIGLRHVGRDLLVDLFEIAGAAEDALARIGGIGDLDRGRRFQGQLHQTQGTRGRGGARIPLRLLVADGCQQAPVLAALLGGFLEPFLVERQPTLQMVHEALGAPRIPCPRGGRSSA